MGDVDAEDAENVEVCSLCEGSGEITFDAFGMSRPAVLREILEDEKNGGYSRTRDAVISGVLKFQDCDQCGEKEEDGKETT
jgi:hypothetical protein